MDALTKQLIIDEGMRLKPYRDTVGKLTIGVGRNLDDNGISEDEALVMLKNDIDQAFDELSQFDWFNSLKPVKQDALVNMCFNLGLPRLLSFKRMIAALEAGDYQTAADEALDSKWAVQVGERANRIAEVIRNG